MTVENIVIKKSGQSDIILKKLTADDGMIIHQKENPSIGGTIIRLAETDIVDNWEEITQEEFDAISAAEEAAQGTY